MSRRRSDPKKNQIPDQIAQAAQREVAIINSQFISQVKPFIEYFLYRKPKITNSQPKFIFLTSNCVTITTLSWPRRQSQSVGSFPHTHSSLSSQEQTLYTQRPAPIIPQTTHFQSQKKIKKMNTLTSGFWGTWISPLSYLLLISSIFLIFLNGCIYVGMKPWYPTSGTLSIGFTVSAGGGGP